MYQKKKLPLYIENCMSNVFILSVNHLAAQDLALVLFIDMHMMGSANGLDSQTYNAHMDVLSRIKCSTINKWDIICNEEEENNLLQLLGYKGSNDMTISKYTNICVIIRQYGRIIFNH